MTLLVYDNSGVPTIAGNLRSGAYDLVRGLAAWRMWAALGNNDVKRRYRRSRLGQLWFTISMFVFVFGLGVLLGSLFKSNIGAILPYFAVNFILWSFVSGTINEACNGFVDAESFMKQISAPLSTYIIRTIYRNFLIFAHNVVIIPMAMIYSGAMPGSHIYLIVPALLLLLVNLLWIGLLLATITARFRDIPQAIQNLIQLFFFMTPIMFRPDQISLNLWYWLRWNPFHWLLTIVRAPILGEPLDPWSYIGAILLAIVGMTFTLAFFGRFRNRIVYWI